LVSPENWNVVGGYSRNISRNAGTINSKLNVPSGDSKLHHGEETPKWEEKELEEQ